jgi:hypothetical protein
MVMLFGWSAAELGNVKTAAAAAKAPKIEALLISTAQPV